MTLPPLRRQVLVACDQGAAYRLFTEEIGRWWPLASFGCFDGDSTVAFDGDRLVETASDGEVAVWGTVTGADPPRGLSFTWHPGTDPAQATRVSVVFAAAGAGTTLVTLEHAGWEAYPDPSAARGRYSGGWRTVLDRYTGAAPDAGADGVRWLILEHTAGPGAPAEGIFSSPDFGRHLDFLRALREQGVLVAGGPLPDAPGTGMTVVRVAGAEAARGIVSAAQDEDGSVTGGLLQVRVRPWRVAIAPAED